LNGSKHSLGARPTDPHESERVRIFFWCPAERRLLLLFFVARGFRFHPSMDILLRSLAPEIEIARIALAKNWRRGLTVNFRQ
jgi:hypothetical protein